MSSFPPIDKSLRVGVVGLGYVGWPLFCEFTKLHHAIGYDCSIEKIEHIKNVSFDYLDCLPDVTGSQKWKISSNDEILNGCDVFVVCVPTPVDIHLRPDLSPLITAMEVVAKWIKPGCVIILESTVYPGCSEEVCIPLVERLSGLRLGLDFHFCYSSERINPGDPVNTIKSVMKVVGGSDDQAREFAKTLYGQFVSAGVHSAGSLKAAEVSKLFENIQRDVNIALANELYSVCTKLGIDFWDALEAAATKWNYARYTPGLVGGHCIGVDPYYLIHKAASVGVNASFITLAREINEGAVQSALNRIAREINLFQCRSGILVRQILFFGLTFKQDVADWRNSKYIELVKMLQAHGYTVKCVDSLISEPPEGIEMVTSLEDSTRYECVVYALDHKADEKLRSNIRLSAENQLFIDGLFP